MIKNKLLKKVLPLAIGLSSLFPTQSNAELPLFNNLRPPIISRLENLIETRSNNNFSFFSPIYSFPNLRNFENLGGNIKRIVDIDNVGEIYETSVFSQDELMKVAAIYPKTILESKTEDSIKPIVYMTGYSAGASIYLDYANKLSKYGYLVLVPEINGDAIHFLSMDLRNDHIIDIDGEPFKEKLGNIMGDVQKVDGYQSLNNILDIASLVMIQGVQGDIQNERVLKIINKHLFKFRDYALDSTIKLIYDLDQDPNSPLYRKIDTNNIGIEGHSLGPHTIFNAITNPSPPFWAGDVKAFISKGGTTGYQSLDNVSRIGEKSLDKYPYIYVMMGESDIDNSVLQPSWDRFQVLEVPSVYTLLGGAGHMVFVAFPLSFIADKYTPFGNRSITIQQSLSAQKTALEISRTFYDAVLKNDKNAMKRIKRENFEGIKESYILNFE